MPVLRESEVKTLFQMLKNHTYYRQTVFFTFTVERMKEYYCIDTFWSFQIYIQCAEETHL